MIRERWMRALIVLMLLGGCSPIATAGAGSHYAPYADDDSFTLRNGGEGGGGGSGM